MYLIKQDNGTYIPIDDQDYDDSKKIGVGKIVKATQPRNFKHHKKAFALLKVGYENQDTYLNSEIHRKAMTIMAGYYDEVIDKKGDTHYWAKSLAYNTMSKKDFESWYEAMVRVVANDLEIEVDDLENNLETAL